MAVRIKYVLLSVTMVAFMWGCKNSQDKGERKITTGTIRYEAQLPPLNSNITGLKTSGKATFLLSNDTSHVTIEARNTPPNIQHRQNFHGTPATVDTRCATMKEDKNKGGILDMFEVEAASGRMMVPFNTYPAKMSAGEATYPTADEKGYYKYEKFIPMEKPANAFADAFEGYNIHLENDAVYIHGVPKSTHLPKTVASISCFPNYRTLPIA